MKQKFLNVRSGDVWKDKTGRRAWIVGGYCDGSGIERIVVKFFRRAQDTIVFNFRYFVRRFNPTRVKRYRRSWV